jgi:release factor glutamine methyltransferase
LQLDQRIKIYQHKIKDDELDLPGEHNQHAAYRQFDMIVSNPPYVSTKDIPKLEPEITLYEDLRALDGGSDGMNLIVPILKITSKYLKPGGTLWLEVDPTHPELIEKYVQDNASVLNLKFTACYKDLFHKDRFVEIIRA